MIQTKATQFFSDEYLQSCQSLKPEQIVQFLDEFRQLHSPSPGVGLEDEKSQLISLKVREGLLKAFKAKAQMNGVKYQTQIKILMQLWLKG